MSRIKRTSSILIFIILILILTSCGRSTGTNQDKEAVSSQTAGTAFQAKALEYAPIYNNYNLTITVEPENGAVQVVEKLQYVNNTGLELNSLYFHVYLNAFSEDSSATPYAPERSRRIFPKGVKYAEVNISEVYLNGRSQDYDLTDSLLTISFHEPIAPGASAEIILAFDAYVPEMNHRTGRDENGMWFGNFIPLAAVYDEFGWHREPYYAIGSPFYSEAATFTATITAPEEYTVISTGIESSKISDNRNVTTVTTKLSRDFSFVVLKDLQTAELSTAAGVYIRIYYRNGTEINQEEYLAAAEKTLQFYSDNVGTYPYTRLDLVECSLYAEIFAAYPEIVFMDSEYMGKSGALSSLAHSIGHQWFYNVVGNNNIKEAWLSESFITCLQAIMAADDESELRLSMIDDYTTLKEKLNALENRTLLTDVSAYETNEEHYYIQFIRGKLMMYSLRNKIGSDKFASFIKTYYNQFLFRNSSRAGFIQIAQDIYQDDLLEFFDDWMLNYDLPALY